MKNIVLIGVFALLLSGCLTTQGLHRALTFTSKLLDGESKDYEVEITGLESVKSSFYDGPTGLDLGVKNNTAKAIKIVWDKCSINKKDVFLSRLRYVDLGQQLPSQTVASGETVKRSIYQAVNVSSDMMDSWVVAPFTESELTVVICLNYDNKDHFLILRVVLAPST